MYQNNFNSSYIPSATENKKAHKKIVFVAATATAIIMALVAAIVVVSVKNDENAGIADAGETQVVDNNGTKADEKTETTKPVTVSTTSKDKNTTKPAPASTVDKVPETGPSDVLPLALGLGALTTLATSLVTAKREAHK